MSYLVFIIRQLTQILGNADFLDIKMGTSVVQGCISMILTPIIMICFICLKLFPTFVSPIFGGILTIPTLSLYWMSFMNGPLVLCIVCNCQGRKNQPPLSLLFCHNYYCAVYKLTSGNCTVVKINNNPTCRLTRPFCLLVFWYYCITLE